MQLLTPSLHLLIKLLYLLLQGLDILLSLLLDRSDVGLQLGYSALRLLSVDTAAAVLAVGMFLVRLIMTLGHPSQA
jgi:hypothetical protein